MAGDWMTVRIAPADVTGPDGRRLIYRGLAWVADGQLWLANGLPSDPQVQAIDVDGAQPLRVGTGFSIAGYTVTSCGCSSPWRSVDTAQLQELANSQAST